MKNFWFLLLLTFTTFLNAENNQSLKLYTNGWFYLPGIDRNIKECLVIELKDGEVLIELFEDDAPQHVSRIKELAKEGAYDGVVFHRVIDGFMAQTGDVQYGNQQSLNMTNVGSGSSSLPNLASEFNSRMHTRGVCSMARAFLTLIQPIVSFSSVWQILHSLTINIPYGGKSSVEWSMLIISKKGIHWKTEK